jgi:DNA-binding transcriptional LysR family regulator
MVGKSGVPESFDLNLLPVLVALDEHRNVTRAAAALGMSQPALSMALGKLREHFGDPLFVRSKRGMQPTLRAASLVRSARAVLALIERDIQGVTGPTAILPGRFTFALSHGGQMVFLPRILRRLQEIVPEATVHCVDRAGEEVLSGLERGEIDLAIGYMPDLRRRRFFEQVLFTTPFVTVLRAEHPLRVERLTWQQFSELEHVVVQSRLSAYQLLERYLAAQRIERHVALSTANAASSASIVAQSDLAVTVPQPLAEYLCTQGELRMVPLPSGVPLMEVKQHWHRKYHHDERSRWLRGVIAETLGGADRQLAAAQAHGEDL